MSKRNRGKVTALPIQNAKKPSQDQAIQLTQLIRVGTDRAYKDLTDWKSALQAAENPINPKRTQLINIQENLLLDAQIRMIRKQLRHHVTGGEIQIVNENKEVDKELTKLFKKAWFRKLCNEAIDSILFGQSLLQVIEANPATNSIKLELVPRKNVVPEVGGWIKNEYDQVSSAINYRDNPQAMNWLIEIGDPFDLGELTPAAPYVMFKKNAMSCWSEFCEKFGQPLVKAKVNARDISAVNRMENFLVNLASSAYAIMDQSEEIDFIESTKSDAYMVFDKLIERCNGEMSKMILLQVMSNDVGANGSRAQAQVHDGHSDEIKTAMRSFIEGLLSETVLPLLKVHGFKTEGKTASYLEVKKVDKDTFDQDKWLEENFDVPVEHWSQKYNTPLQGRKEKAGATPPTPPIVPPAKGKKGTAKTVAEFINSPVNSIIQMHKELNEIHNKECKHEH